MNKIHKRTFQRDGTIHSGSVQLSGTSQLALCPLLVFLLSLFVVLSSQFSFCPLVSGWISERTHVRSKKRRRCERDETSQ